MYARRQGRLPVVGAHECHSGKVAGVEQIIMTTPPGADGKVYPSTLVAAREAGVDAIYKVGGAQAIAAMAFGTESIRRWTRL